MSSMFSTLSLMLIVCAWTPIATALDVFKTEKYVRSIDGSLHGDCVGRLSAAPLELEFMIEQVICRDPKLRQAWADAKLKTAQVGVSKAAYFPKLEAETLVSNGHNVTEYKDQREYSTKGRQRRLEQRLSLSWVLFDFGGREAAVHNATKILMAANAAQDMRLQSAFLQAAQLYYETLAAQDIQLAAGQVTSLAAENLKDASAKYEAGAAALSDRLQAQTAYTQANLDEVRGAGAVSESVGQIALLMGLPPDTPLVLQKSLTRQPRVDFLEGIEALLRQARQDHPALVAAKAKLEAAQAAVEERRAAGRPILSLVASVSDAHSTQSAAYSGDTRVRDNSIGLQLKIPLFEGFERTYQVRAAQAVVEASEAELADTLQSVSVDLWINYQVLNTETLALQKTGQWVDQATRALEVVRGRYRSGVGSMTELLSTTAAFSTAQQQHIRTLKAWHIARLRLAASLGRLGFWTI